MTNLYTILLVNVLTEQEELKLMQHIIDRGVIFLSTPYCIEAVKRLEKFDVPAFKVGSGECNNIHLIEFICKLGKPIIMSTGMNSLETIENSVNIIRKYKVPYALLHCTNVYPTPPELVG